MKKQYIYPQNMRASATLWLWSLKDFAIITVATLLSALILTSTKIIIPAVITALYAFLSIRTEDDTILDYIKYGVKYFITTQQYFEWGLKPSPIQKSMKEVASNEKKKI